MGRTLVRAVCMIVLMSLVIGLMEQAIGKGAVFADEGAESEAGTGILIDEMDDFTKAASYSTNDLVIRTGNAEQYGGDNSRMQRKYVAGKTSYGGEYVIYRTDYDMTAFTANATVNGSQTDTFTFYGSSDGVSYSPIDAARTEAVNYGWRSNKYESASIPSGIRFLMVVFGASSNDWNAVLNKISISYKIVAESEPGEMVDELDDFTKLYDYSADALVVRQDNPAQYGGDSSRLQRKYISGSNSYGGEYIVYKTADDIVTVTMNVYVNGTPAPGDFLFFGSEDGVSFAPLAASKSESVDYGWRPNQYEITDIPDGTTYLKIQFGTASNDWNAVVNKVTIRTAPSSSYSILANLRSEHPRILASEADFATIRTKVENQTQPYYDWYLALKERAQKLLTDTQESQPVQYQIPDPYLNQNYLLGSSREVIRRIETLGMMYWLESDEILKEQYKNRAWMEMEAVAGFPDWTPYHFLSTAEMARAMGEGYDWFHDGLTEEQRAVIRNAIVDKSLNLAIAALNGDRSGPVDQWAWANNTSNWSIVCNGGIAIATLAIADEIPELAEQILQKGMNSIKIPLPGYAPDGAWREGAAYWGYATKYLTLYIAGLESALGSDYGFLGTPGLSRTGEFPVYITGPEYNFNYGDANPVKYSDSALYWLAGKFNNPLYTNHQNQFAGDALKFIWYDPATDVRLDEVPLDRYFRGTGTEMAFFRSAWEDENAMFTGLRAGNQNWSHNNLDAGTFVLDALGERWAEELGYENYAAPGFFDYNEARWRYYRTRAEGQNTLVINPGNEAEQDFNQTTSAVTVFESDADEGFAIADLTAAYAKEATTVKRGLRTLDHRRQVLVRDEVEVKEPSDIWWFMHTKADIDIAEDGQSAVLTKDGQRLYVAMGSDRQASFVTMDAKPLWTSPQPAGADPNVGFRKLALRFTDVESLKLSVWFVPLSPGEEVPDRVPVPMESLDEWTLSPPVEASLAGIHVDGEELPDFSENKFTYSMVTEEGEVPTVTAFGIGNTAVAVTQANAVPGTAVIKVSPSGGASEEVVYKLRFRGEDEPAVQEGGLTVTKVSASTYDQNYVPENTLDNVLGGESRWSAEGKGQWIQYDLGEVREVTSAAIAWFNGHLRNTLFDIEVSVDGHTWTQAYSGQSSGISSKPEYVDINAVSARYVRIVGQGNSQSLWNSMTEARVFDDDEQARLYVNSFREFDSVALQADKTVIPVGGSTSLSLAAKMNDGTAAELTEATIKYESDDESVVTVSQEGTVAAVGEGSASIAVIVVLGDKMKYDVVEITVIEENTKSFLPIADTFVWDGAPEQANGSALTMNVKDGYSGYDRQAFMVFDLDGVQGEIESAMLYFYAYVTDSAGTEAELKVFETTNSSWEESQLTWNSRPSTGNEWGKTVIANTAEWHEIDVTTHVAEKLETSSIIGLAFVQELDNLGLNVNMKSKEDTVYKPYLKLKMKPKVIPDEPGTEEPGDDDLGEEELASGGEGNPDHSATIVAAEDLVEAADGQFELAAPEELNELFLSSTIVSAIDGSLKIIARHMVLELPADLIRDMQNRLKNEQGQGMTIKLQATTIDNRKLEGRLPARTTAAVASLWYDFEISYVAVDDTEQRLDMFKEPIKLTFQVNDGTNLARLGVYAMDANGYASYVGGAFDADSMIVSVHTSAYYGVLEWNKSYTDVTASHWAYQIIGDLAARHVILGKSETQFAPSADVTRAEFAAFAARLLQGKDIAPEIGFEDVSERDWYYEEVMIAASLGIFQGDGGKFEPKRGLTRQELAVVAYRMMQLYGKAKEPTLSMSFLDATEISSWALPAVTAAAAWQLMLGDGQGNLRPHDSVTRAECAAVLSRLLPLLQD